MAGEVRLCEEKLIISEDVEEVLKKEVTPFGTGAHVVCPKEHKGEESLPSGLQGMISRASSFSD